MTCVCNRRADRPPGDPDLARRPGRRFCHRPRAGYFVVACVVAYVLAGLIQHLCVRRAVEARVATGRAACRTIRMACDVRWHAAAERLADHTHEHRPAVGGRDVAARGCRYLYRRMRTATLVSFVMMVAGVVAQPRISALHTMQSNRELSRVPVRHDSRRVPGVTRDWATARSGRAADSCPVRPRSSSQGILSCWYSWQHTSWRRYMGPLTSALVMTGRQAWAAYIHAAALPVKRHSKRRPDLTVRPDRRGPGYRHKPDSDAACAVPAGASTSGCRMTARVTDDLEPVHVAVTCDENYAMPLAAMLASLTASLDPHRRLVIHALGHDLQAPVWDRLTKSLPRGSGAMEPYRRGHVRIAQGGIRHPGLRPHLPGLLFPAAAA